MSSQQSLTDQLQRSFNQTVQRYVIGCATVIVLAALTFIYQLYQSSKTPAGSHGLPEQIQSATLIQGYIIFVILILALLGGFILVSRHWLSRESRRLGQGLSDLLAFSGDIISGHPERQLIGNPCVEITTLADAMAEILQAQREQQTKLESMAYIDSLTQLQTFNRFYELATHKLKDAAVRGQKLMLIYFDINNLKHINSAYGHEAGDLFVKGVATLLSETPAQNKLVTRRAGDEFLTLTDFGESLLLKLAEATNPLRINGGGLEMMASLSMGVARFPEDANNLDDLVICAHFALAQSKRRGDRRGYIVDNNLGSQIQRQRQIEERVVQALRKNLIQPHYQPIVDLKTQEIVGFEALMHWIDDTLGWIKNDDFLPIIERLHFMPILTQCLLDQIIIDRERLRDAFPGAYISFNVSPQDFFDHSLIKRLKIIAESHPHQLQDLVIELTELDMDQMDKDISKLLEQFIPQGLKIAIDDFGKGFSSLDRLANIKFQRLKIDKSLISDLPDERIEKIIHIVTKLGNRLDVEIVAEGIEREVQRQILLGAGCHYGQGWLFYRSMPIHRVLLLSKHVRHT